MADLAEKMISDIRPGVGRPRINSEVTPARFPEGTLARIAAVLEDGEKQADFLREAVVKLCESREAAARKCGTREVASR